MECRCLHFPLLDINHLTKLGIPSLIFDSNPITVLNIKALQLARRELVRMNEFYISPDIGLKNVSCGN